LPPICRLLTLLDGPTAIASFVDLLAAGDPARIDELDRMLKAKRRALAAERKGR
jgi:hypothetical protein